MKKIAIRKDLVVKYRKRGEGFGRDVAAMKWKESPGWSDFTGGGKLGQQVKALKARLKELEDLQKIKK